MKGSKTRILKHLEERGSITSMEAFQMYGITRLAARIKDLRDVGYDIDTLMMKNKNRFGETIQYAKYVLKGVNNGN